MHQIALRRMAGWLAGTSGILALALNGVGVAAADDFAKPFNIQAGSYGACMDLTWQAEPTGVTSFSVERKQPFQRWEVQAGQRDLYVCGMEPGNWYDFEVCSYYGTEEGDTGCAQAHLQLKKVGNLEPSGRPPQPQIVETPVLGPTSIGVKWDAAGFEYDSYFVNYTLKGQGPNTIHHDDDGTWGYQRIDGLLPSRTYILQVQGCTEIWFGIASDRCWDWSPPVEVTTAAYPLHSGPDTCAPGFVWREAWPEDHVCVSPPRRDAVKADNAQASGRRAGVCTEEMLKKQTCPLVIPDTCKQGFVWREARPEDHVCVTPAERDLVRQETATANQRLAQPR